MQTGTLKGIHVVVLMFAVLLLAVPASDFIASLLPDGARYRDAIGRALPFLAVGSLILAIGPLRRMVREQLAIPIPGDCRSEVAAVYGLQVAHAFAWLAAYVLWFHLTEGPVALEQRLSGAGTHVQALAAAFSTEGFVVGIVLAGLLGPVVEELVFRGLLYRLWERRFGWFPALVMASTLFGLYHANFLPAFASAVILTCLYRRTGSLRAPMFVHALYNLTTIYPLAGRWIFPRDFEAPGDLASWKFHIALLIAFCVAWPAYLWIARNGREDAVGEDALPDHVVLPR